MAFADSIVHESTDRTVIMVDKLPQPGGHWNHAYDFVKLHQPACFYGVASEKLEQEGVGANQIKYSDLSGKKELLEYYRFVMDKLVKTGRVKHFGECTYNNEKFHEIWNYDQIPIQSFTDKEGVTHEVRVKRRVVDGTYLKIQVPSQVPPKYKLDPGVTYVPVNGIGKIPDNTEKFLVVGAGKTGIDANLHLLENGVDPDNITWVMPNDSWLIKREDFDPRKFLLVYKPVFNDQETLRESLLFQEREGWLTRLDKDVWPEKYKCATVESAELEKLRSIRNVIRQGRVSAVTKTHLVMRGKDGNTPTNVPYPEGSLVVDCSAGGLPPQPEVPIFQGGKLVLQPVRYCIQCHSAAMVAYVDCHKDFKDDDDRNSAMFPIPYPVDNKSYVRAELLQLRNHLMGCGTDPRIEKWTDNCRLHVDKYASTSTLLKMFSGGLYSAYSQLPASLEAKQRHYKQEFGEDLEFQTYSPSKLDKMIRSFGVLTLSFWAVVIAVVAASLYGLQFLMELY